MNSKKTWQSFIRGLLYIMPALVLLMLFTLYPLIKTIDMSFYIQYNYFKDLVFERGLGNYSYLVHDKEFIKAVKNTFIYVISVMPLSILLSLFMAILLNSKIKFKKLFQTIYFLPFVTSTVAISIVWNWIYHSDYGVINYLLGLIGISPIKWLLDPKWAMVSLVIMSVWKSLGYNIIIFLAGLQNINAQYYKASRIDGATPWQRTMKVTLPLLSPTIFFICVITLINSFKVFDQIYALFGKQPGPLNSCLSMVYYIYEKFYNQFHYGIASAAVVVLYIIILILNVVQFKISNKKVHYS
ncbi:MAG: carbohydrate ABC transporter permease [Cellulosilyticaceae bacterium]